jgi:hypothetical protein
MPVDRLLAQVTRSRWDRLPPDYRTGTPGADDTKILRHTTDKGTVLTPVQVVDRPYLFPIGALVATPAALDAVTSIGHLDLATSLMRRHRDGDWGDLTSEDLRANDVALTTGGRLLSAYTVGSLRLWVITEADRSATTFLLPSDY